MKVLFVALLLSVLGSIVQASTGANGAELMFFYYTYQMEFLTKGEGNTNIATTCKGSGGNPCTLIEFLKTIITPKHNKAFQYALSFLTPEQRATIDTTSPDMKTSSETLHSQLELPVGNSGATKARAWFFGAYDGTKFFKGYTEIDLMKNKPMGEVFADITNTLQEVRKVRNDKGLSPLEDQLVKARKGLEVAHAHRIADQDSVMVTDLEKASKNNKDLKDWKFKTKEVTIEDGRVYLELDIPQSLQVSGLTPDSPQAAHLTDWIEQYVSPIKILILSYFHLCPKDQMLIFRLDIQRTPPDDPHAKLSPAQRKGLIIKTVQVLVSKVNGPPTCD